MATHLGGGSTRNGRDSAGRRLGVKKFGGEYVLPGNIIIRQRGTKYHTDGITTYIGKDHTIHAKIAGHVLFVYGDSRIKVSIMRDEHCEEIEREEFAEESEASTADNAGVKVSNSKSNSFTSSEK